MQIFAFLTVSLEFSTFSSRWWIKQMLAECSNQTVWSSNVFISSSRTTIQAPLPKTQPHHKHHFCFFFKKKGPIQRYFFPKEKWEELFFFFQLKFHTLAYPFQNASRKKKCNLYRTDQEEKCWKFRTDNESKMQTCT